MLKEISVYFFSYSFFTEVKVGKSRRQFSFSFLDLNSKEGSFEKLLSRFNWLYLLICLIRGKRRYELLRFFFVSQFTGCPINIFPTLLHSPSFWLWIDWTITMGHPVSYLCVPPSFKCCIWIKNMLYKVSW